MRKKALFVIVMLLLILTLLPITPTAAVGPKPKEKAIVTVSDGITGGPSNFDVGLHGKLVIVYGDVDLTVELYEGDDWWDNFDYEGKLGIRMNKRTGEVHIIYMFDEYVEDEVPERYEGAKKYQLETYGTFSGGSIPYGTVEVDDKGFIIYQIFYQQTSKKNGKGATGVTYDPVFPGEGLSFTITINEV